jgi:hypothetical protein
MENLLFSLALLISFVFLFGMFKPNWIIPNAITTKRKRLKIFISCFLLFWIFLISGSYFYDKNLTPQEKLKIEQQRVIEDSIKNIKKVQASVKDTLALENHYTETTKGDSIDSKNYHIEVSKIKDKKRNAGILEAGYGKYRYYYLKITNRTKYPRDIDRDNFYVESEDGAFYEHSTTQAIADFLITINRDAFAGEALAPNVPVNGIIAFEVPKDGKFILKCKD